MAIEVHFEKRINNLNVIREADTRTRREYLFVTLLTGLFVVGLFFYGWQHYQWIQYGYRIEEAQKKKDQLAEAQRQLRVERELWRDLKRIDAVARGKLGMVLPAPGQMVIFKADAPLTIPVPASSGLELQAKK